MTPDEWKALRETPEAKAIIETTQAAGAIVIAASDYIGKLIQAANRGDKRSKEKLHQHIHAELEYGAPLEARLVEYVAAHGLPPKGKVAPYDKGERELQMSFALAIRIDRGEAWQDAIAAVAKIGCVSVKTVEAIYKGDTRQVAEQWAAGDKTYRLRMVAIAAPYLKQPGTN